MTACYHYYDAYGRGRVERRMTVDGNKGHDTNPYFNTDTRREQWQRGWDDEVANPLAPCKHEWDEQPGEPPVDICIHCGEVRE